MVSVGKRLNNMVISRLHPVGDGDIIVPQRNLSTIGSTQWITDDPDDISIPQEDIDYLMDAAGALIPSFADHPIRAAWTATRPLAGSSETGGRELSRDFACINHGTEDGIHGFFSVTGGKATVLRAMAEKTVDALCEELGFDIACSTADVPLDSFMSFYRARVPVAGTES
jgi:glycerol-3-phosphate dehydrogenase